MDWWTSLAASFVLLWLLCFLDGNAVLELRLLFHALTKAACHMYLALLPMRRAGLHLFKSVKYLVDPGTPPTKKGTLHFLEGLCVVFETVPDLLGAGQGLCAALCHALQGTVFLLASTLRVVQVSLLAQVNGEKDRWEKERIRAKEGEKRQNQKVVEYLTVFCQDPVTSLRLKVDMNR